jgi:hypothetical protein
LAFLERFPFALSYSARIEKAIQAELSDSSSKDLHIKDLIDYEEESQEFQQEILSAMELYTQFWDKYDAPNLLMQEL